VLPKFVSAYNNAVHTSTGMGPSKVTDSDVLAIWKGMKEKRSRIRTVKPKLRLGKHVRISKEKIRLQRVLNKFTPQKSLILIRSFIGHPVLSMSWNI
jgi:hypothetical protein